MLVSVSAIVDVLNGVEANLKEVLHDSVIGIETFRHENRQHLESSLRSVQDAITSLLNAK